MGHKWKTSQIKHSTLSVFLEYFLFQRNNVIHSNYQNLPNKSPNPLMLILSSYFFSLEIFSEILFDFRNSIFCYWWVRWWVWPELILLFLLSCPPPLPRAEGSITNSQDEVSLRKKNGKGGVKSTPGQVLINSFLINCILYDILTLRYHGTLGF